MHTRIGSAALAALALTILSCSDTGTVSPVVSPAPQLSTTTELPSVRFSELHYDNVGTDEGEAIEISGPAGRDLTGWQVVLYNGANGQVYNTRTLSETIPATCGERGVIVLEYAVNGIQNGDPDGLALIDASGNVVEFLSYEGTFTAVGGPANGIGSTDIGVSQGTATPVGHSLQRNGAGVWSAPAPNTFGECNDDDDVPPPPPPPPPPGLPETRFSEIHYDNAGTDAGEAIEIEGPAGTDLTGWSVVLYNGNGGASYNTQALSGTISDMCDGRGVVVLTYPQDGIQNGSPDGMALVDASGKVVEFLSYEGTFTAVGGPANGMNSTDIGVSQVSSTPIGLSLQRKSDGSWEGPVASTFGACNGGGDPPPPPGNTISFAGRTAGDPPLPVGFQDQLFATVRDGSGTVLVTTITWSSETPDVATIDENGVMTALAAGTATVRATAEDGTTTATFSLPTRVAVASETALYEGNAEFGEPADGDPGDDHIIRRPQFTASYNHTRGTPNWVSYNLEATHFGTEDRCDCFTFDPLLPSAFPRYTTADYTGAGAFHGYGIDRGHLARSFDRTSGSLDNAATFYFSNIIPQAADLNQGPWAIMENHLGDLARLQNREVYVITGVAGSKGTVKDEGKITIPESVWKVAVILPRDRGLAHIRHSRDLEVIAALMPNDPGIRSVSWETYKTTVDAVEAVSGYDLLALLPDHIELAVEGGTNQPTAMTDGPYTSLEGSSVAMSGAGSSDLDGDALMYAWTFGDGGSATGVEVSRTYVQDGVYAVRLIVTDILGIADTTETTATIVNVAPEIAAFDGATLLPGETYAASGSFTDPGADAWSATVDYGDGSGTRVLALAGTAFSLSHTYTAAGTFTVTVRISDDDATSSRTATVTVLTPTQAVEEAVELVNEMLEEGTLDAGTATSLTAKLEAALRGLADGSTTSAMTVDDSKTAAQRDATTSVLGQLGSVLNQLEALVRSGRHSAAELEPLRTLVSRVIRSLSR